MMDPKLSVEVRVTRYLEASPENVFDAWLVPRTLGTWMFGPRVRNENVIRLEVDPRVGGSFSLQVERNGQLIDHVGTYLVMDRPSHLAFTWAVKGESDDPSSEVHLYLAASGSGCLLTLVHHMDSRWADYAQRTQQGWTTMLDALAASF